MYSIHNFGSRRIFFILFFFFTVNLFAQANVDSLSNYNLDEITVTATRSEKEVIDVGRSVSVITKDDINNSVYLTPSDLIAKEEGVLILGGGQNPGALQNIYMRGANNNQTVFMIDGLRITDPSTVENTIDLAELTLMNINRIEMVRGSHSTLYGSSAIGGVVNIVTDKNRLPGLNVDALLQTGTFGAGTSDLSQNLSINYTTNYGFYFSGDIYNSHINGLDATVDTVTSPNVFKNRDKDNFRKTSYVTKIGFASPVWDVYLSYSNNDQHTDIDNGAFVDDDNYTVDFKRDLINYGGTYKFNDWLKLSYIGGYTDMTRTSTNDSSIVDAAGTYDHSYFNGIYDGTSFTNEVQFNIKRDKFDAVIGGGLYKETMNINTYVYSASAWGVYEATNNLDTLNINTTTKNAFAYVDLNGSLLNKNLDAFNLALGGRYNYHSTFGDKITYEINPSYKISKNVLLYFSYATGFNAPPLYRLFSPEANYQSGITRGNKNLQPEFSRSIELGWKQILNDNLSFQIAAFSTNVENYIEYVYLWDKNVSITDLGNDWMRDDYRGDTYINLGTMKTRGVEFRVDAALSNNLFTSANVSFIDGEIDYSADDINNDITQGNHVQFYSNGVFLTGDYESNGLVRRAVTANLSISYLPFEPLSLRLNIHYVGKKDDIYYDSMLGPYGALGTIGMPDYTLFDISAAYKIMSNLSAVVKIENLFDKKYYEIVGYTTRGRSIYMNLRYSFNMN